MENLILVAAIGKNNELGLDNNLIWRIQEDLSFYRRLTLHNNIIMGRKTFESMPPRALEERNVFVISSKNLDQNYNINCFNSIEALLDYVRITDEPFIVVGGSQIYNELLPYVNIMYLTEIDEYANADTFFPEINMDEWNVETIYYNNEVDYTSGNIPYVRNKYVRKRVK